MRLAMLLLAFASLAAVNCDDSDAEVEEVTREHMEQLHDHIDGDKDGKVSLQEILKFNEHATKVAAAQEIETIFHEMKSTQDGHLSFEEHMSEFNDENMDASEKARIKANEEAKFKAADLNGDGKLDKTELVHLIYPQTHPEVFALQVAESMRDIDENSDGMISLKEWSGRMLKDLQGLAGAQDGSVEEEDEEFTGLDANKDGFLDREELKHYESGDFRVKGAMTKLLQDADEDSDAHLTKAELAKMAGVAEDHPAQPYVLGWVFDYLGGASKDEM